MSKKELENIKKSGKIQTAAPGIQTLIRIKHLLL